MEFSRGSSWCIFLDDRFLPVLHVCLLYFVSVIQYISGSSPFASVLTYHFLLFLFSLFLFLLFHLHHHHFLLLVLFFLLTLSSSSCSSFSPQRGLEPYIWPTPADPLSHSSLPADVAYCSRTYVYSCLSFLTLAHFLTQKDSVPGVFQLLATHSWSSESF